MSINNEAQNPADRAGRVDQAEQTDQASPAPAEERITRSLVRDVQLPHGAGVLALLTLDNGLDHSKPTTLGPSGLNELDETLTGLAERAARGEIVAVGVTGKPHFFCAGADLTVAGQINDRAAALALGRTGHRTFARLHDLPVRTFAFINGLALGGGFELALHCDYRSVASDAAGVGLPETSLGLIPGWGGTYLVPRLVGTAKAVDVILTRPARNKPYKPVEALDLGLVDALFESADFLEQSLEWAASVLRGELVISRREPDARQDRTAVLEQARGQLDAVVHGSRPAPYRALALLEQTADVDRDAAFAAEDEALADLIMSDELRASLYAFNTVNRGKRPQGAPDSQLAQPVTVVGVVGAGLMAAQLALLFAQRLGVTVIMRDLDEDRVAKGLHYVQHTVEKLNGSDRMSNDVAARVLASIRGTTKLDDLAPCDFVIEAVTEDLNLKKHVFAELESIIDSSAILATNTSALSVSQMAEDLKHPERVVGLHFFNPVAQMPLVEIVQAASTSQVALATAFGIVKKLRKTPVAVTDRPGFVVNRLLVLLLGEIVRAVEDGTPVEVADRALQPLGLPMGPFALFDLVGPAVGLHVLTSLREGLGDRFARSPGLEQLVAAGTPVVLPPAGKGIPAGVDPEIQTAFGPAGHHDALDEAGVLDAVLTALAVEVGHMLEERVVDSPTQIDLAMILGAGWPFAAGGICPLLDRTGYSQRVLGRRLLPDGTANVPSAGATGPQHVDGN